LIPFAIISLFYKTLADGLNSKDALDSELYSKERRLSKERIVNGKEVNPPGKYSWIAYGNMGCAASLIAPNVLLGSTSCPLGDKVLIGAHNIPDIFEDREVFTVVKRVTHPNYSNVTYNNDLSVMKIDGVSKYTPVVIDDGSSALAVGDSLITMGWGSDAIDSNNMSDVLLQVEVDYVSNSDCDTMYEDAEYGDGIYGEMICASRTEGNTTYDACIGDGGGPLIKKSDSTQVGVVSWGEDVPIPLIQEYMLELVARMLGSKVILICGNLRERLARPKRQSHQRPKRLKRQRH